VRGRGALPFYSLSINSLVTISKQKKNNKYEKRILPYDNKDAKRPSNYYNKEYSDSASSIAFFNSLIVNGF